MQRVLDIDLDFFVEGVAHCRSRDDGRLNAEEYPPWKPEDALSYLRERCRLTHPLPGGVVEHHGEVFHKWRSLVDAGLLTVPFHVTHIDAHSDLSWGELGYQYLLTELVHLPVDQRADAAASRAGDGDYLALAIGCRWISDLSYVYCPGGGSDVHPYMRENFEFDASAIRLAPLTMEQIRDLLDGRAPSVASDEPQVSVAEVRADDYIADGGFDLVFLARSPPFTPAEADPVFDEIREAFIDETALKSP